MARWSESGNRKATVNQGCVLRWVNGWAFGPALRRSRWQGDGCPEGASINPAKGGALVMPAITYDNQFSE